VTLFEFRHPEIAMMTAEISNHYRKKKDFSDHIICIMRWPLHFQMKSNILIIRFHYSENDQRFDWRFGYFKAMVLPRIINQTDQNFDIGIRCNPKHADLFKALSDKIITFQTKNDDARYKTGNKGKKYFEDFVRWDDVIGLEKYDIQTGIDSDDLMDLDYIKIVNKAMAGRREATHLCFQPELFDLKTLEIRPMQRYHETKGSAFMALFQPNKSNYKFLYERSYLTLFKYAKKSIVIPRGHCWATAHWINESTGK